jgi:hypothetical protein
MYQFTKKKKKVLKIKLNEKEKKTLVKFCQPLDSRDSKYI